MRHSRQISVGGVPIGGGAPVVVQSMTTTKTHDVDATLGADRAGSWPAGCEIVRVAVPGPPRRRRAAGDPGARRRVPIIADIHFNASLALQAMEAGVAAVRINPGNIGGADKVQQVVERARRPASPLRIGANAGSLPDHLRGPPPPTPRARWSRRALEEVELLERLELPRLQDLGEVLDRAGDDPGLPAAGASRSTIRCTSA